MTSYRWLVDNSIMTYDNFSPGQPAKKEQLCVAMNAPKNLKWVDNDCSAAAKALCEADLVSIIYIDTTF